MSGKCPICGQEAFDTLNGEFRFDPPPNIPGGTIIISNAAWGECSICHEQILSHDLEQSLNCKRYERLGRLLPENIKAVRERLGLTQMEMAKCLSIGEKTYTRWETGRSLQNKANDNLIRLVGDNPEQFLQQDAQRAPDRGEKVKNYLQSLNLLKGSNQLGIAAHGEINKVEGECLEQQIRSILKQKRGE
jgi:putative zinc finger/helix-turn-helix YgiT family protein